MSRIRRAEFVFLLSDKGDLRLIVCHATGKKAVYDEASVRSLLSAGQVAVINEAMIAAHRDAEGKIKEALDTERAELEKDE